MSAIGGIRASLPALAVVPRVVTPLAPVPPRRRGGAPSGDTLGPEDVAYTIIEDAPTRAMSGPRRGRTRRLAAGPLSGGYVHGHGGPAGWGDAIQAYAPYREYLGLYVDLWV